MDKVKGKTLSGFKYELDPNIFQDWDFLEIVDSFQHGDESLNNVKRLLVMMISEKGFNDLKEHIRKKYGTANVKKVVEEFTEMCNNPEIKNYLSSLK